jgi:IS5 family transposase
MKPKTKQRENRKLFERKPGGMINSDHPQVKLAELTDWQAFEELWSGLHPSRRGRPATPTRLIAGFLYSCIASPPKTSVTDLLPE